MSVASRAESVRGLVNLPWFTAIWINESTSLGAGAHLPRVGAFFLKLSSIRQQSLPNHDKLTRQKTGSNLIITMGNALVRRRAIVVKEILVVEDFCHLRELLGKILASRGWDPILAESGREALAKLECQTPRIILMDMRLPDISGFVLAAILKKHPVYRNIPILAATGSAEDIARQRCLSAGCDDFISKPFTISVLERRLTNLVSAETPKPIVATGL